jgi:hypothetical protein
LPGQGGNCVTLIDLCISDNHPAVELQPDTGETISEGGNRDFFHLRATTPRHKEVPGEAENEAENVDDQGIVLRDKGGGLPFPPAYPFSVRRSGKPPLYEHL